MKQDAEEGSAREAELMRMEIKQLSSHTLKRLLRVSSVKPRKSVVTPTSPVVEQTDQDDIGAENKIEDSKLKDTIAADSAERERRSGVGEDVRKKSNSSYLSVRVDSATNVTDVVSPDVDKRRSTHGQSRDFAANDARSSRTSDVKDAMAKDADHRTSELRLEVDSDASGEDSSSDAETPRFVRLLS